MNRNQPNPDLTPTPAPDGTVEAIMIRALERHPSPAIPPDFAARVARMAAAQPTPHPTQWIGWGPRLALASGALLMLAMFALAPGTVPTLTNLRFDTELALFAELSGLLLFAHRLLHRE